MDATLDPQARTFIEAAEVWVPHEGRLVHAQGSYGTLDAFAEASARESFARGEGLPGKAWAEARPVVMKSLDSASFKRTEAARAAGLSAAVAIPVFAGPDLKAVLVVLCANDADRIGAIEIWAETDALLMLEDGYFGAARQFEGVSQHTQFPIGQGLPGGVWAARTPILMRDLGSAYRFVRAESAGRAGLTTGLGLPVPVPGKKTYVLTLLSARGTPLARRFEIWDARSARVGKAGGAVLVDGSCAREGPLWDADTPRRAAAWEGPVGTVLGNGLPLVLAGNPALCAGYDSLVALPLHLAGELAFVVAWYC